jgi:SAM-dependent methyltransferase
MTEAVPTVSQETIRHMTRNEADMAFKKRVQTVFEWVDPRPGDLILDIPCGRGFYLNMFDYAAPEATVIGADLEWDVLEKAQRNTAHIPGQVLHGASIYSLPYPSDTFDAVILSEVLEHLADDVAGLREVWRVLKPGGVVAITVPNANYPFWWDPINKTLETLFNTHISKGPLAGLWANHHRLYEHDQLRAAATEAGFIVAEERAFTHHSFPFIHNLVYGLGKPLLESGALPGDMATAADRTTFDDNDGSLLNPINLGVAVFNYFDRPNVINEPPGKPTVNLALKGRKPEETRS